MKKFALLSLILAVIFAGFGFENTVRLTIINQSEVDIGIRLVNAEKDLNYYLTIVEGDKDHPTEKDFFIERALYDMQVYYIETWDPVYGYPKCDGQVQIGRMLAKHNLRVVFDRCYLQPAARGEPSMLKFWRWLPRYWFLFPKSIPKYIYIY